VDSTPGERPLQQVLAPRGRRTVVGTLLGAVLLSLRAIPREATARQRQQAATLAEEPGPVPPKCAKLGQKCFSSGDCCGPGTRCKRAGRNQCRCQANRAKCGPVCCPTGQACCDQCADLQIDTNNCGACFTVCGADETCGAGTCTP
jgi:hypothetical protein